MVQSLDTSARPGMASSPIGAFAIVHSMSSWRPRKSRARSERADSRDSRTPPPQPACCAAARPLRRCAAFGSRESALAPSAARRGPRMLGFTLNEEQEAFRAAVRGFAEKSLAPQVEELERTETFPKHLFRELGRLGYLGVGYPEEYGGSGGGQGVRWPLLQGGAPGDFRLPAPPPPPPGPRRPPP